MAKSEAKKESADQEAEENDTLKECFIITPIGIIGSDTFKKADGLIKSVIDPVLRKFNFKAVPAYEISHVGSITKQVIEHVINDELVIANLTGLNPNVMYELALRHAYKKKVITMAEDDTKLPFDISDQRTIFYDDSLYGTASAKALLEEYIRETLANDVTSNPVIDSVQEAAVISSSGKDVNKTEYMLNRFDRLERLIMSGLNQKDRFMAVKDNFIPRLSSQTLVFKFSNPKLDAKSLIDDILRLAARFGVQIRSVDASAPHELEIRAHGTDSDLFSFKERILLDYKPASVRSILMS